MIDQSMILYMFYTWYILPQGDRKGHNIFEPYSKQILSIFVLTLFICLHICIMKFSLPRPAVHRCGEGFTHQ